MAMKTLFACGFVINFLLSQACCQEMEFNSLMMESTFKIQGPSATPGKTGIGTCFFLAKASNNRPGRTLEALVTADHVLTDIVGESATLFLREKDVSGLWHRTNFTLRIRNGSTNLWLKHPRLDLAAMWVDLPSSTIHQLNGVERVFSTADLQHFEIHPGDKLCCLGYPLGLEGNDAGFPILRTGTIASYPLYPVTNNPTFLFDFNVFGGNSGGPVYFIDSNRFYGGGVRLSELIHGLVGIVVQQQEMTESYEGLRERRTSTTSFGLGVVIQGEFIQELVRMLPEK
jgi:hypothetical protein